jgi:hypothetical protein
MFVALGGWACQASTVPDAGTDTDAQDGGAPDASDGALRDAHADDAGGVGTDALPGDTSGVDADQLDAVSLSMVQQTVFRGCLGEGCHSCMFLLPDAGCAWDDRPLDLLGPPSDVIRSLVGVPAIDSSSKLRVKVGDPDHSFIVQKLEGHLAPSEGASMPLGRSLLPQSEVDVLRAWIAQGASAP